MSKIPRQILPVIVFAQFAGTSLWFAGNAVVNDLIIELDLLEMFIGFIAMAIQSGFIIGTLVFALLNIADRFSPVKVFLICSLAGASLQSDYHLEFQFYRSDVEPGGNRFFSCGHLSGGDENCL